MFSVRIEFTSSYYTKMDASIYQDSMTEVIEYTANKINDAIKEEAPVRTGNLRDGHIVRVNGLSASILNDVPYAPFVIYGTSRQAPNNYPQRAINHMNLTGEARSRFSESLITKGVL